MGRATTIDPSTLPAPSTCWLVVRREPSNDKKRNHSHLQQRFFAWVWRIASNECHEPFDLNFFGWCPPVAGVLLSIPFHKEPIAGIQQRSKSVQQRQIRFCAWNTTVHNLQVATYLPFLHIGDPTIVLQLELIAKHCCSTEDAIIGLTVTICGLNSFNIVGNNESKYSGRIASFSTRCLILDSFIRRTCLEISLSSPPRMMQSVRRSERNPRPPK